MEDRIEEQIQTLILLKKFINDNCGEKFGALAEEIDNIINSMSYRTGDLKKDVMTAYNNLNTSIQKLNLMISSMTSVKN